MADSETLRDLFVDELKDAYDAEKQLIKALRKMSKSAFHPELADAFSSHLDETSGQVGILEDVFSLIDERPRGKHCAGIAGIIEEGNDAIAEKYKSPLLDAFLVGGGKRAEHYEIAAYTTLKAMADELGYSEAAERLDEILQQEIACDQKLDSLGQMLLPLANQAEDEEEESGSGRAVRRAPARKAAAKQSAARKRSRR